MRVLKAYEFYFQCGVKNALRGFVKRLRQPRYLVGFLLIAAYLTWVMSINLRNMGRAEPGAGLAFRITDFVRVFFVAQIVIIWLFSRTGRGFNFKNSETNILFAAPLRRRDILLFKWLQVMPPVFILSCLVGVFALFSAVCHPLYAPFGVFIAWNLVHLHQIWVRLMMQWLRQKGLWADLSGWVLQSLPLAGLGIPLWLTYRSLTKAGEFEPLYLLVNAPFSQVWDALSVFSDAALAQDFPSFARGLLPLLGLLGFQALLVLRSDIAFEDQAIRRAEKLSRVKTEGVDALKDDGDFVLAENSRPLLNLATKGPLWRAIVWKNLLSIGRLGRRRIVMTLVFSLYFGGIGAFVFGKMAPGTSNAILGAVAVLLPYLTILAPAMIRVDLRIDIPHFDLIKSLPVRGRELLFGEILAGTFLATIAQALLVSVGAVALIRSGKASELGSTEIAVLAVALVIGLAGLNFALFAIANLIALYFPSITKLGRGVKVGIDQMGVQFIGAVVRSIALAFELLAPALVAGLIGAGLRLGLKTNWSTAGIAAALAFSAVLVLENLMIIRVAERRYDSFDLSQEKTAAS
ncbi:MAG: putative ABC exporter domain-containing protein [Planctomycetota bacterium]